MDDLHKFLQVLWGIATQLPSLLTMLACLVFAIIRWKRHPKISLTVIISLALLLMVTLVFPFVYSFVPELIVKADDFKSRETVFMVISFLYNALLGIALAVLLAGIFSQRETPAETGENLAA
jgi:hypothetical protein